MLLARAEIDGRPLDVRLVDDRVTEIGHGLRPEPDEHVLDARGGAVIPGLHDHHLHLRSLAAARDSVDLRSVSDAHGLRAALAAASTDPGSWLRAVGYHESIAGTLDRVRLDDLSPPGVPVRVQHRSGVAWILNSSAVTALGLDGAGEPGFDESTGHLWRRDDLLRRTSTLDRRALTEVGEQAAALGVTGLTDATPDGAVTDARDLARDLRAAGVAQNLHLMAPVGADPPGELRATVGPVKLLLDDNSLDIGDLGVVIREAHDQKRTVAVHCVTRVQLVAAVTAFETAGAVPGDRIEHGSVVPAELLGTLARLGLTVVTQPHFVAERGDDYLRDVDPDDQPSLYRIRSLLDAGIPVAAGTDAPFGAPDPWASMAAAVTRRTRNGQELGPDEGVDGATALGLYLGTPTDPAHPRSVAVGGPADLCVLSVAAAHLPDALLERPVAATIIAGDLVYERS